MQGRGSGHGGNGNGNGDGIVRRKRRVTERGIKVGYLPPPVDFGAPPKFDQWREEQEEAVVLLDESVNATSILDMPTGTGKSQTAYMYALMSGKRTLILTEAKGLQDQYYRDYSGFGLADIRGANNYPCPALQLGGKFDHLAERGKTATCDKGPCRTGLHCELKAGGCPYYDALRTAKAAPIVVTNYANWLVMGKSKRDDEKEDAEILGKFDCIVMDELHAAAEQLSKALTVELNTEELQKFFGGGLPEPPQTDDIDDWLPWVKGLIKLQHKTLEAANAEMKMCRDNGTLHRELMDDVRWLRRLGGEVGLLDQVINDDTIDAEWVVERYQLGRGRVVASFQPVWPTAYYEKYLARGIKRRIGMSATIIPYMVEKLGVKPGTFDFWSFDSPFPVTNRPIYVMPSVFMRYDMPHAEKEKWARTIDTIANAYRGMNGIVHTVSYERAKYYREVSKAAERIMQNAPTSTSHIVEKFKLQSASGLVLVSPSVGTGYDFPGDTCRWQIMGKVPFVDKRSRLMQRRTETDKQYANALAMLYIVQAYGRAVRSRDDWADFWIIDGVFLDWWKRNKRFAPPYFNAAVKQVSGVPKQVVSRSVVAKLRK